MHANCSLNCSNETSITKDEPMSDILTGLDAAIADGADVISISIGEENMPFFQDSIAIASFAAIQKGIFVSCVTGNSGPFNGTATNIAPWVNAVKFNEYSSIVVSAGYDRSLRAWDCKSHSTEPIRIIDTFLDSVMSICLTKTEIIAGSVDGTVRTFDIRIDGTVRSWHVRPTLVLKDDK
ncbi:subtilisin-like protease [Lactuca sativa]|uniref:subtilisin-like protease n=1 Tax=Lactuca sativa TaxID=4236 RepID=UPI0022AF7E24|nr:subtilisin-like protease [Lactuca sativa]